MKSEIVSEEGNYGRINNQIWKGLMYTFHIEKRSRDDAHPDSERGSGRQVAVGIVRAQGESGARKQIREGTLGKAAC